MIKYSLLFISGVTLFVSACASTPTLKYQESGLLSAQYKDADFLATVPKMDAATAQQIAKDLSDQTHRSTTLKKDEFSYDNIVNVELVTPFSEMVDFNMETSDNKLLTPEMKNQELQRRLESISKNRTCFFINITEKNYYSYQSSSLQPVTSYGSNGSTYTSYVSVPYTGYSFDDTPADAGQFKWTGALVEAGSSSVPLNFYNGLACAEKALNWKAPFSVFLGAGKGQESAFGRVSWYFNEDRKEESEMPNLQSTSQSASVLNLAGMKQRTVENAIATDNIKWLKKEIPLGQNLTVLDRGTLMGLIFAITKENDGKCSGKIVDYLYDAGAFESKFIYENMDKEATEYIYRCPAFARHAFIWTPNLRSKIFASVHKQFVDVLSDMDPSDSPAQSTKHLETIDLYKFIHRGLSSECLSGHKDLCVLLDMSKKTMRAAAAKLAQLDEGRQNQRKVRALLEQIIRNERQRQRGKTDFI